MANRTECDGLNNDEIAARLAALSATVGSWRNRFA